MIRNIHNSNITITTLGGKVMSGEEFLSNPPVFGYEDNKKLIDEYAYRSSPSFRQMEKAKRNLERVEQRRQALEQEQIEIKRQLDSLTE